MASKPAVLRKNKKRQQPTSSSSSQKSTVTLFDPVDHALHLDSHLKNANKSISQIGVTAKDWIQMANNVNKEIDSIIESRPDDQEIKRIKTNVRQLTMTFDLLAKKISELEKTNNENQSAFEIFKSSTFEYLLGTISNDTELISQFEQTEKEEKIKIEKNNDDSDHEDDEDDSEDEKKIKKDPTLNKKKMVRRGLFPPECR